MAFVVQDDTGATPCANAYIDEPTFIGYHADRGNSIIDPTTGSQYTDTKIQWAIVKATDFVDRRFQYVGIVPTRTQTTNWPRIGALDISRLIVFGVPQEVKFATAEYALRALVASLAPDPTYDATGAQVQSSRKKVGPIEKDISYVAGAGFAMPRYPLADSILSSAGLVLRGTALIRA